MVKDNYIICIGLRIVTTHHTKQQRLARAVRPRKHPPFPALNLPIEPRKNIAAAISGPAIAYAERYSMVRHRRGSLGKRHMHRQLHCRTAIRPCCPYKPTPTHSKHRVGRVGHFVRVGEQKHNMKPSVTQSGKGVAQLGPRRRVETDKRIVEHKNIGSRKQCVYNKQLAQFAARQIVDAFGSYIAQSETATHVVPHLALHGFAEYLAHHGHVFVFARLETLVIA